MKKTLPLLLVIFLLGGCAQYSAILAQPEKSVSDDQSVRKYADENTSYRIGKMSDKWRRLWGYDADMAFFNDENKATIVVNSTCGIQKQVPLTALRNHLLFDMTDRLILEQEKTEIDMREGLRSLVQGRLDGGLFKMEIFLVLIDNCVYDFVYIVNLEKYKECRPDFISVVKGFHARRDG